MDRRTEALTTASKLARSRKGDLRIKIAIFSKVASLVKEWFLDIPPKDLTFVARAVAEG